MNMKAKSHHLGVVLGVAVIALFAAVAWQSGPTPRFAQAQALTPLLADGTLGRAVVEFIAAGFALGALGVALKLLGVRVREFRSGERQRTASIRSARVVTLEFVTADATASEFDEFEPKRPGFAPIVSLTEAQVHRQRAQRAGERRRATLGGA